MISCMAAQLTLNLQWNSVGIESTRPIVMAEPEESCLCTCPDLPEFNKISKDSKYLAASHGELVTAS